MKKKILITTFIVIIFGILCYSYNENYTKSSKIPCNKWSKEVLLAEGNIDKKPAIIKNDGYYYIAYSDRDILKVLKVNKLGEKQEEYVINIKYKNFNNIGLLKNKDNISINFTTPSNKGLNVVILELDKNMNIIKESTVKNVSCKCEMGNNMLVMAFKDVIEVRDLFSNSVYKTKIIGQPSLIAANMYKNKNYIMYSVQGGSFAYFTLCNGRFSQRVNIGVLFATIRVSYESLALCVNDDYLCSVVEAMNLKEGSVFSIVNKINLRNNEIDQYVPESLNVDFSSQDIVPAGENGKIKFLVSATRE